MNTYMRHLHKLLPKQINYLILFVSKYDLATQLLVTSNSYPNPPGRYGTETQLFSLLTLT